MPAVVIAALVGAGATAGGAYYAGRKQDQASALATNAANHAADVQGQSNAAALEFAKQQAAQQLAIDEANRRGNYDQWAAGQRRLGSVGALLGQGPRDIPAYVPIAQGGSSSGLPATATTSNAGALAGIPAGAADVYNSVRSQGPPTASSLDDLAKAYAAKGYQVSRPNYNGVPSGNELLVNGTKLKFTVGDVGTPGASWYTWGTPDSGGASGVRGIGSYFSPSGSSASPFAQLPISPGVVNPYQVRPIGSYFQ